VKRILLTLAFAATPEVLLPAQAVEVEASVNARRIGVEDVLELTVSIHGGKGTPRLPEVEGFRVTGPSTSSQVQIVNGQMSSTSAFIYDLLPEREGTFVIGPIPVDVSGDTHTTEPIEVEVVAGSLAPRRGRRGFDPFGSLSPRARRREPEITAEDVFLRTEVSKSSVYQGETVVVTYRVFSKYVPHGPQVDDDPPLTGFWVEDVDLGSPTIERTRVDGEEYLTFPIKRRVLFPTRTGELTIPSMTLSMAFRLSSNDPFDTFFARASRPVSLRSPPEKIDVKPLPSAGRPRDFAGAVGRFELEAELKPESVEAGDPVTLTLTVTGNGNLRSVEPPELPDTPGLRRFDPKMDEKLQTEIAGLRGTKTWEYVLVPETGGTKELGPWHFSYFDPKVGEYVERTTEPLKLRVSGASTTATNGVAPIVTPRGEIKLLRQDIRYLKEAPESLGVAARPFYGSAFFFASLVLPVLWNFGFVVYLKRKEREKTHSTLFRSRRAQRMARGRLERGRKLASLGSKEFYEEVAAALYRYVGDKKSKSPSGLTMTSIGALLENSGVDDTLRSEFLGVLDECEEARFTPGVRSREAMESLLRRARELIVSVEKQMVP